MGLVWWSESSGVTLFGVLVGFLLWTRTTHLDNHAMTMQLHMQCTNLTPGLPKEIRGFRHTRPVGYWRCQGICHWAQNCGFCGRENSNALCWELPVGVFSAVVYCMFLLKDAFWVGCEDEFYILQAQFLKRKSFGFHSLCTNIPPQIWQRGMTNAFQRVVHEPPVASIVCNPHRWVEFPGSSLFVWLCLSASSLPEVIFMHHLPHPHSLLNSILPGLQVLSFHAALCIAGTATKNTEHTALFSLSASHFCIPISFCSLCPEVQHSDILLIMFNPRRTSLLKFWWWHVVSSSLCFMTLTSYFIYFIVCGLMRMVRIRSKCPSPMSFDVQRRCTADPWILAETHLQGFEFASSTCGNNHSEDFGMASLPAASSSRKFASQTVGAAPHPHPLKKNG